MMNFLLATLICCCISVDNYATLPERISIQINNGHNINQSVQTEKSAVVALPYSHRSAQEKSSLSPWIIQPTAALLLVGCSGVITACIASAYVTYSCLHHSFWAQWPHKLSSTKLSSIPQDLCARQLFTALMLLYDKEGDDFLNPLVRFINALEQELTQHKRALMVHNWLEKLPGISQLIQKYGWQTQLNDQVKRLHYLRTLLITHIGTYQHSSGGHHDPALIM